MRHVCGIKSRTFLLLCPFLLIYGLLSGCGSEKNRPQPALPELKDISLISDNRYSCTFDSLKHDFIVDLPDNAENAPLVLMLHGYGHTAESFRTSVQFEKTANPAGYAVAYVTSAADPEDRSSSTGWNAGAGTSQNRDTEFLKALARYLQKEYSLDRNRTYAAGFSNGGFMAHRLAAEAGDTFSALVSVAGIMTDSVWENRKNQNSVSFFQITGAKDDVVPKNSDGTAKYSKFPAIEDVMAYWTESNGAVLTEESDISKHAVLKKYENKDKNIQVWDLLVKNGGHEWPKENFSGFDTNALILEFFEAQK